MVNFTSREIDRSMKRYGVAVTSASSPDYPVLYYKQKKEKKKAVSFNSNFVKFLGPSVHEAQCRIEFL